MAFCLILNTARTNSHVVKICRIHFTKGLSAASLVWVACLFLAADLRGAICSNNDGFACRLTLSGNVLALTNSNVGATREAGEPMHAPSTNNFGTSASNSLWYTWTAPTSGGVVIEVTDLNGGMSIPVLAVYRGSSLGGLTRVAANSAPLSKARVVFTASAGTNYQIAVDGAPNLDFFDQGQSTFLLTLTNLPPPANDLFTTATVIPGEIYETRGSFRGASREAGEPAHGNTNFNQTLWWSWTLPGDLVGVSVVPIRIMASAVSFPPAISVYTGASVANLSSVTAIVETNGMTSTFTFNASVGSAYRIAVAGLQHDDSSVLPFTGNYQFRLNTRPLAVSIPRLAKTNNADGSISFSADVRVENKGTAGSNPLRVYATAIPGASMRGGFVSDYATNQIPQGSPSTAFTLAPGQSNTVAVTGVAPAPTTINPGDPVAVGYGIYARLQEQVAGDWSALDQSLVFFGNWPSFDGVFGPGGGVIRLDPNLTGAGSTTLTNVAILGATNMVEGSTNSYTARAKYANATQFDFTNTTWTSSVFTVSRGMFSAGIVTSNTPVMIGMYYSNLAQLRIVQTNLVVSNLPPPKMTSPLLVNKTNFAWQIQGVPFRKHAIEAATGLTVNTTWVPLLTNALDLNGRWNFTNALGTNQQRYFRGREVP
jgi:hypothetical protein